jgi:hypothetical protein
VWHVSIAVIDPHLGVLPTERVSKPDRKRALGCAEHLLRGVGRSPNHPLVLPLAFHLRRLLAPSELRLLDPAWLAIPARDYATAPTICPL